VAMHSNDDFSRDHCSPSLRAGAPKEKISLSLRCLAFLILYCINKAQAIESERSFTVSREVEEGGEGGGGGGGRGEGGSCINEKIGGKESDGVERSFAD